MGPEVTDTGAPSREHAPLPRQEIKHEIFELLKMVALFLVLFWAIKSFVVEGYEVQGPSMTPTLDDRERILVFKLSHQLCQLSLFQGFSAVDVGDIVVFDSNEHNKRYIKRVVAIGPPLEKGNKVDARSRDEYGVPEDTPVQVEFQEGRVLVNNEPVVEDYLPEQERQSRDRLKEDLGPGEYFVLGDHRSVSKDSRSFGPIDERQIIGRAVLRFWPLSKFGLL